MNAIPDSKCFVCFGTDDHCLLCNGSGMLPREVFVESVEKIQELFANAPSDDPPSSIEVFQLLFDFTYNSMHRQSQFLDPDTSSNSTVPVLGPAISIEHVGSSHAHNSEETPTLLCECTHPINSHDAQGCFFPFEDTPGSFCSCTISITDFL